MKSLKILCAAAAMAAAMAIMVGTVPGEESLRWPVDLPRSLTGTHGEQRGDHLHSGIDIKTAGRTGHRVYAVDDGLLLSITARSLGYGNSIILGHGSFFSQYAHLDSFVEGAAGLDTLVETVKLLYGDEIDSFSFKKRRLRFKKGELIGYSGETGAGPPHLHFALREPGGPVNPLEYYNLPDTEAPVIKALSFCVEKGGSTVSAVTIPAYKSWGKYALRENVFVAGPEDRCFIKLSCYDRVSSLNRCAVNKILLSEGDTEIFSMDFQRFKWADSSMGRFIYDRSITVIGGESLYTFFLCRRTGNKYSRIRAVNDGYLKATEEPRKFRIDVFDQAGNKSSLEFGLIRKKAAAPDPAAGYIAVSAGRGGVLRDASGDFTFTVPRGGLYDGAMLKVETAKTSGQVYRLQQGGIIGDGDSSTVYTVLPFDQVYRRDSRVSIRRPEWISKDEADNILIYRSYEDTAAWGLLTVYNRRTDCFEANTSANGRFVLMRDRRAPEVHVPASYDFIVDDGPYRKMRLHLFDDLSGVNTKSVWLYIDGENYPALFDYDRSWIEAKLPKLAVSKGVHHVFLRVRDRANNETIMRNLLVF